MECPPAARRRFLHRLPQPGFSSFWLCQTVRYNRQGFPLKRCAGLLTHKPVRLRHSLNNFKKR
ncbi:hypothetical protein C2U68_20220 [Methylomonas koyamae]|nr:hypothetical protein C2U68_20220 [Methylomonas koyamae]